MLPSFEIGGYFKKSCCFLCFSTKLTQYIIQRFLWSMHNSLDPVEGSDFLLFLCPEKCCGILWLSAFPSIQALSFIHSNFMLISLHVLNPVSCSPSGMINLCPCSAFFILLSLLLLVFFFLCFHFFSTALSFTCFVLSFCQYGTMNSKLWC